MATRIKFNVFDKMLASIKMMTIKIVYLQTGICLCLDTELPSFMGNTLTFPMCLSQSVEIGSGFTWQLFFSFIRYSEFADCFLVIFKR